MYSHTELFLRTKIRLAKILHNVYLLITFGLFLLFLDFSHFFLSSFIEFFELLFQFQNSLLQALVEPQSTAIPSKKKTRVKSRISGERSLRFKIALGERKLNAGSKWRHNQRKVGCRTTFKRLRLSRK